MALRTNAAPHRPLPVGGGPDDVADDAFPGRPFLRVTDFLRPEYAADLLAELRDGLEYERVDYAGMTRLWRGARPVGDAYFGDFLRRPGWRPRPRAVEALRAFESDWFVSWLSRVTGTEVAFLRPPTAYRLGPGDRICLHDDMSNPDHTVSVAYHLTPDWRPGQGGETTVGEVASVTPVETPADSPIDLQRWELHPGARTLEPVYNSILVLRLGEQYAHGVEPVTGTEPRHSITTIYGRPW